MRSRGLAELLNLPSFATGTCLDRPNLSLRVLCVQELVLKIAILAEKNAPNFGWYVDVLLSTLVHFQSLNASFLSYPLHFLASDCISLHQFAPFLCSLARDGKCIISTSRWFSRCWRVLQTLQITQTLCLKVADARDVVT